MDDFISLAAAIPLVGGVVAIASAIASLKSRSRLEEKFVRELSDALEKMTKERHLDAASYRHIYFSGVRGRAKNQEFPVYLKDALLRLDKKEKAVIVDSLNQPSASGRVKYFDKVFKSASAILAATVIFD